MPADQETQISPGIWFHLWFPGVYKCNHSICMDTYQEFISYVVYNVVTKNLYVHVKYKNRISFSLNKI